MSSGPGTGAVRRATPADKTATTAASSSRPASKAKGSPITTLDLRLSPLLFNSLLRNFCQKFCVLSRGVFSFDLQGH